MTVAARKKAEDAMTDYHAPLKDIRFTLAHIADLPGLPGVDMEMLDQALAEAGKLAAEVLAPLNRVGDQNPATVENGVVRTPPGFREAYAAYRDGGWNAVPFAADYGGMELPVTFANVCGELWNSANMGFALCPLLNIGAVEAIHAHGTPEQKDTYLPKMISGEWSGTMNLTEPQAGSDVGALTTRAEPAGDGTWRIKGTKIFITYGEHDFTDNIVHLVLARTPDSPPGTRGISLFIVPKFLPNADGTPGKRNDLRCVSLEHKLGIHASPTAVMSYGDNEGAVGFMLGEENKGMRAMFTMMNNARLAVGIQGVAIAERAYQQAVAYALERKQGKPLGGKDGDAIVAHADVRRMLLTMKAYTDAMRALCYVNAEAIDRARHGDDADERERWQGLVELLTPVSKGWATDLGCEVASIGVQVHGGMGFIEETGAAQHMRDARIAPIYEGTNGIQAMDLVMRKLPMNGGQVIAGLIAEMRGTVEALGKAGAGLAAGRRNLADAVDAVEQVSGVLLDKLGSDPNGAAAGCAPYLRMMGLTVGGWLLARGALNAVRLKGEAGADTDFLDGRIVSARFYLEQLLPQAVALAPAATAGADLLYALPADRLIA
jgi:alkylation response protein AidB-like acyl-CoA dehydrogenase